MLDKNCKDASLDGCSVPRVQDGFLVARCVCGATRTVPTTTVSSGEPCEGCGATTGDGLMQGPDRVALMQLLAQPRTKPDYGGYVVYFARVGNLVKIGTTGNVWHRMAQLGHPELLGVLPGAYDVERRHHQRFAQENVKGEVFEASPRLLAYVAEHCTMPEQPAPRPRPTGDPNWKPPGWMHND